MIWVCPVCKGNLSSATDLVLCDNCNASYPCVGNIPDLRLSGNSWLDHDKDLQNARSLHLLSETLSLEDLVRIVFARQPGRDESRIKLRTRQVLEAPIKYQMELSGWLYDGLERADIFLEIGCGGGMLLAVASRNRKTRGIDVSMEWLVVAERLIREYGSQPCLAAANAEHMPLAMHSVSSVVSLDVIEHVSNPVIYLSEIDRVLKPGGHLALSTPNRYSLTAEPHVFVWGVGWIPRQWQPQYVRARSGKEYINTCLLSYWEIKRMISQNTNIKVAIMPGTVPETEIATFPTLRSKLARIYNLMHRWFVLRWLFLVIAPLFQITGVKQHPR